MRCTSSSLGVVLWVFVVLTLILGACASNDGPELAPGVVPPADNGDTGDELSDIDRAQADAEAALASAWGAWNEGDPLGAFTIANQALRRHPPDDLADALRSLRSRARAALVGSQIVDVRIVPQVDAVTAGRSFPIRIVFTNRSPGELRIPNRLEGSSQALLLLEISRRDFDVYGNSGTTHLPMRVPLSKTLLIPPGGSQSVELDIGPSLTSFTHQGFAVLTLGGSFRPVVVQVGETEFFDALQIDDTPVRVFMPGYEQLTEDPLKALGKAIAKRSPAHILTAAELLAPRDRERAIVVLARAASNDAELTFVLDAAARRLRVLRGEIADE